MSENRDNQDGKRQVVGTVKKSFLLVLIGGLIAEWARVSLKYARRSPPKKP
jgi:hypothetical protein